MSTHLGDARCVCTDGREDHRDVSQCCNDPLICAYCGEAPAEGYVPAYKCWVCQECYEDHHGPVDW
jgi:hypothetical protein